MAAFGNTCYSSGEEEDEEAAEGYRKGGYHAARPGDRFVAQRKLGWGNFSTVWLAYDTLHSRFVALKIQKSARDYAHAALHEIELLSAAAKGDPTNSKCVIQLLAHFKHAGPNGHHVCLVTEFLGNSLLRLARWYPQAQISKDLHVSSSSVLEPPVLQLAIPFHYV